VEGVVYVEHPAPEGLADAVTRMWFLDAPRPRRYEKILPMPFAHTIVNLSDPYRLYDRHGRGSVVPPAFVSGLQSEYLVIESTKRIRHLGIEFTPTGLARFAPQLARTTVDRVLDAATVLDGITAIDLRVPAEGDPDEALAALDRFLRAHTSDPADPVITAAIALIHADTERPMNEIASELGIVDRALVNRFRRTTGTTPKRHAEVVRFHRLIDAVHAGGGRPDWADLAVAAGYYDQPHVIREFRRFSGWTPARYYRMVAEHGPDAAHFVPLDHLPAQASS
jgi:AraC-like DNA-binding protein